ncbi:MAG: ABC transporter ATP-binding protein [Geminicoccaceae bacterium]|nr:ABC transporter ATP-binding protein [Geminicoccaceae bacterium]
MAAGATRPGEAPPPAVELQGIDKWFGTNHANRGIDLAVMPGTIHGIIGENGAGKSTLMNILFGFLEADGGRILVDGEPRRIRRPEDAIRAGIGMVHQHFMLVEPFTVVENVLLGAEEGPLLRRSRAKARAELGRLARDYALDVPLDAVVHDLPVGLQQRVEILKALYRGARILILDEPTGVLTPAEADHLFRILTGLRDQGRTVLLITHKLREIMAVTDRVSVMRQGAMVAHRETAETSREDLAELMVGHKVILRIDKGRARPGAPVLEVRDLWVHDRQDVPRLKGLTFDVRAGEIVGVAGVSGNGQSELLEVLSGILHPTKGEVRVGGEPVLNPAQGRSLGVGHVPEDRLRVGLVRTFPAWENAVLGHQRDARYEQGGFMRRRRIRDVCRDWMRRHDVRPQSCDLEAGGFSGGNQQKLVLAREMEHEPGLLLVGQPTRGVDIGAIELIHKRLVALRDRGKAILLVSVELDEVMALADRILVMFDGTITGEVPGEGADERRIGLLMAGIAEEAA